MSTYILSQAFKFSLYIYFLLYDWRMLAIYWTIILIYTLISHKIPDDSANESRLKIRLATWDSPTSSASYVKIQLPVEPLEKLAAQALKKNGTKITITHLALKALGYAMNKTKGLNGKIIFGKYVEFETVNVSALVDIEGKDLAVMHICGCEKKTVSDIAEEVRNRVKRIKEKKDTEHQERTKSFEWLPDWAVNAGMMFGSFVGFNQGMDIAAMKLKKNGMGPIMLTNVSGMNYKEAFAPLCNFMRSSMIVVLCKPFWEYQLDENGENGKNVKIMNTMITVDHRFMDGSGASQMVKSLQEVFGNPEKF